MSTKQQKEPLLNTKQVMAVFGVSDMTVFNWRHGTASKKPLPTVLKPVGASGVRQLVGFKPSAIKRWAAQHAVHLDEKKLEKVVNKLTKESLH